MFVCPHCQFENPTQNRFCQRCGNALRALQAIVMPTGAAPKGMADETSSPALASPSATASSRPPAGAIVADLLTPHHQLKDQPRYQLRQVTDAQQALGGAAVIVPLVDSEPATDSPLIQFLDAAPDDIEEADIDAMMPSLAFPYWQLQEPLYPIVPELQAAWQTGDYTIIVVEDRSTWRTLSDLAAAGAVEPLECVHWFYEMVNLWTELSTFEAESSLLAPDNIRVDDDQVICLQRLIFNLSDRPPTLKTLGQFWQTWWPQLVSLKLPALEGLVADMAAGEISEVLTIKDRLAAIADQLQEAEVTTAPLPSAAIAAAPDAATPLTSIPIVMPPATADTATAPVATDQPSPPPPDAIADPALALGPEAVVPDDLAPAAADEPSLVAALPALAMDELLSAANLEGFDEADATDEVMKDGELNDLPTMALPMKLYRLDEVGRTHVGRQRSHNEDSFFAETQLQRLDSPVGTELKARGLYILCDGMGGHSGGEVASQLAVTALRDYFTEHWQDDLPEDEVIKTGILQANQVIFDQNESEARSGSARMGTTLVMVLVANQQVVVAHVGDSRLYCLTRQGLTQATVDHEVGQREINRGVEPAIAYARPDAFQLTQALGPRSNHEVAPSLTRLTINQDTLFVLCSDGLSDNDLLETHVGSHLEPLMRSKADLDEGVANLIDLANEHNGHDNITAIVVRFKLRPNLDSI